MSYSDDYKDQQAAAFYERWTPRSEQLPEPTPKALRHAIAHWRASRARVEELEQALRVLRNMLESV